MASYRAKRNGVFIQGWQVNVADYMFRGFTDEQIINEVWPEKTTPNQIRAAKQRLRNLRRNETFQEYYRGLVNEWSIHHVGRALNKLADQIDSNQPWLANKAANDVLLQSKQMITGMDDGTVVVKIEGMPELGTPDD